MQFLLGISALMAAIVAMVAMATDNAVTHSLTLSLSLNATDVLTANGIWAPNLTAFAQGEPNIAGINFTTEGDKLVASGIDINDLVNIDITTTDVVAKHSCDQCNLCLKAVAACGLLWFL